MRTTRSPARRLVAVLLLSLVAALAPVAGSLTAEAVPATAAASVGQDVAPAEAPRPALLGRSAHDGPVAPDATGHPGPALDLLVLDAAGLPHEAPGRVDDRTTAAAPEPGTGADIGSRGPRGPDRTTPPVAAARDSPAPPPCPGPDRGARRRGSL
ncbi:hypothetical protein [Pseudonocardia sp. ICBG601]|uniref:hypothetical protein n=1 Tax=Pseudonocardia sp. ICBG601 TaxID=2846759 RepID=UPI001CF70B29|nr:hypothetical protein [Pseudonocardia sp. ICBG601]